MLTTTAPAGEHAGVPEPTDVIGGDVRLYRGDSLRVLTGLPDSEFDAVITDPPYSSGGMTRGDRANQSVAAKYVQTGTDRYRSADFAGDNRDQRGWGYWCYLWMSECLRVTKPGGYILVFTDWRQLPAATDAIQAGGWVWRGILSWDKGPAARSAAPHYFRHQCEYVVWGTRGAGAPRADWPPEGQGCYPGAYTHAVRQDDKHHVTGKPTRLMRDLVFCVPPGGKILDPFMGSGTTIVAAAIEGRAGTGIETDPAHYATALKRLTHATGTSAGQLFAHTGDA